METCRQANERATVDDETPDQLVPVPKSRCFCFPQRTFIITLAFIRLVLSLGLLVIFYFAWSALYIFGQPILLLEITVWIPMSINVVDIIFGLFFIRSVCVKNRKQMKIYYIYSTFVVASLSFFCIVFIYMMSGSLVAVLKVILICSTFLIIQEYLNHLVKSEIRELEKSEQIQL